MSIAQTALTFLIALLAIDALATAQPKSDTNARAVVVGQLPRGA